MINSVQLYKDLAFNGDKGTQPLSLVSNDQVIGYILQVRSKNGATNNDMNGALEATIETSIKKIEITSGANIFYSTDGEMCRKIATDRNGKLPQTLITGILGGTWAGNGDPTLGWQQATFPIDFCIKQDPQGIRTGIIFPAPLFNNLMMSIDYDFTISATAGFVTGGANHVLDLYAITKPAESEEVMKNHLILVHKKQVDYTTLASGDIAFKLTKDNNRKLRKVFVNVYAQGVSEGKHITYMVFRRNGQNSAPRSWGNLQAENADDSGLLYRKRYYADPTGTSTAHWTRVPAANATVSSIESTTTPWVSKSGDTLTVTIASGQQYMMEVASDVLPGMAVFNFDKDGTCVDLVPTGPADGTTDLDINITQGTASGVVQILEQQVCKVFGI